MYTCAYCTVKACMKDDRSKMPANCPLREEELVQSTKKRYEEPEVKNFFINSSELEGRGYSRWPRIIEIVEFCKQMGYKKIGMAFCMGLHNEAKIIHQIFESHGLEVVSVVCKAGGIKKEDIGIRKEWKVNPEAYETMCNPITQAVLMNKEKTDFNVVVGLCVGHDSLFYKNSDAPVTTLVTKDRVLAHNPIGAVYCSNFYYKKRLDPANESHVV